MGIDSSNSTPSAKMSLLFSFSSQIHGFLVLRLSLRLEAQRDLLVPSASNIEPLP
jgi:hypothetical protein